MCHRYAKEKVVFTLKYQNAVGGNWEFFLSEIKKYDTFWNGSQTIENLTIAVTGGKGLLKFEENRSTAIKQAEGRAWLSFIDCRGLYLYYWLDRAGWGGAVGESRHSPPPPGSKRQRGAADVMPTALEWRGQLGVVVAPPLQNALLHKLHFVS